MNDKRYIGIVVQTRVPFIKTSCSRKTVRNIQPKVIKTEFFPNYRKAIEWLRKISDSELRNYKKNMTARYIRPIDLQRTPGT